jgi:hypothetical protein
MNYNIDKIVTVFEGLTRQSLGGLGSIYGDEARFIDPFTDVSGLAAVTDVFEHMFDNLNNPRFVIIDRVQGSAQCVLTWDFHFHFRRFRPQVAQRIHGASHLFLGPDGRIALHRDYWDSAHLYEALPVIGGAMRWLRRRAGS